MPIFFDFNHFNVIKRNNTESMIAASSFVSAASSIIIADIISVIAPAIIRVSLPIVGPIIVLVSYQLDFNKDKSSIKGKSYQGQVSFPEAMLSIIIACET
jgi:hypothetical protein